MDKNTNTINWMSQLVQSTPWIKAFDYNSEEIITAQNDIAEDIRACMEKWCDRRYAAVTDALNYAHCLTNGYDVTQRAAAWDSWVNGARQRLAQDARDQIETSQNMMRHIFKINGAVPPAVVALVAAAEGENSRHSDKQATASKKTKGLATSSKPKNADATRDAQELEHGLI